MRTGIFIFVVLSSIFGCHSAWAEEAVMSQEPPSLSDTYWWVEDIDGRGVIDNSHSTIGFLDGERVAGDGSCNRYMGSYRQQQNLLEFGALAGTLRACPDAIMEQDRRLHSAMARVVAFRVEPTGLLHLLDKSGQTIIRAVAIERDEL